MKLQLHDPPKLEDAIAGEAPVTRDDVVARVRRFAVLRAAQRALTPSSTEPIDTTESGVISGIRRRLGALTARFDACDGAALPESRLDDELRALDDALAGFARSLLAIVEKISLAQLRASLSGQTHPQRVEVAALLQLCLEGEPTPSRYLRVVDFLVTLLSTGMRDGKWVVEIDPANLNDTVRNRCALTGYIDTAVEARIVSRFQGAAERVASGPGDVAIMEEISAYKVDVASFYFNPAILRCIVGYNVAARNHFEERMRRGREMDAAIDDELGLFAPLVDQDPRAGTDPAAGLLPPHESPGVLAVQEAIRRRLQQAELARGPAERIAEGLDLDWLAEAERSALLEPEHEDIGRIVRLTVVLGHLAMSLPEHEPEFTALGLREGHLDAWICALGDEVQAQIDTLIRDNRYDGAVRLGDVKSRYLAAVLLVARRRLGRRGAHRDEADNLERDAIGLVREHLERERFNKRPPVFNDLFGGGWRRTLALSAVGLLVAFLAIIEIVPSSHPRKIRELEHWQARDISTVLTSAYRDYADDRSMFVGILAPHWSELAPNTRYQHAEVIRTKVLERGVEEVLLFDEDRVLQAHYFEGAWRTTLGWESGSRSGPRSYGPPRPR
jgi:hypothetical protein